MWTRLPLAKVLIIKNTVMTSFEVEVEFLQKFSLSFS